MNQDTSIMLCESQSELSVKQPLTLSAIFVCNCLWLTDSSCVAHPASLSTADYCEVNVCSNGGTCVTGAGALSICICPDGFTGDTCNETETGKAKVNSI